MFYIKGNHDNNLNDGGFPEVILSDKDLYDCFITKVSDEVRLGKECSLYYYRDKSFFKIRYIFLDSTNFDDDQQQWMVKHILELPSDWNVIVFTHHLFGLIESGTAVEEIKHPGYCTNGKKIIESIIDIKPKARIIAIISGHCHYDFSSDEHGFWEISTTCDTRQESSNLSQTLETVNEHAFDVFFVDIKNKMLSSIRIGRGSNRSWSI